MGERNSEIVITDTRLTRSEVVNAVTAIRGIMPDVTSKTLTRYIAAGFIGDKLDLALELVSRHQSSLPHIVRWNQKLKLSMSRIKLCLAIRDEYGVSDMSVALISRYLTQLGFSEYDPEEIEDIPDSVMMIFSTFMEIAGQVGGRFPVHQVWHRIEEQFGANVQEAYHMALENEATFIRVIRGELSRSRAILEIRESNQDSFDDQDLGEAFCEGYFDLDQKTQRAIEQLVRDAGE